MIEVSSLEGILPHRHPMVWIDRVLLMDETSGMAETVVKDTLPYWGPTGVLPFTPIEWMAQAAGYCAAARVAPAKLGRTFLAGLRDVTIQDLSSLRPGDTLRIHVERVKVLGPLALVRGRVMMGEELLARAMMKLFGE